MKVISVELFVKKFLRFLEEWNAKTSGVKEVLAFANEGVSGGAAKTLAIILWWHKMFRTLI